MKRDLMNAVVVVTGASSGIGRAAAVAFAQRGAHVVLAARNEEALHEALTECESHGPKALAVPTNVTEEAAVRQLAHRTIETFGKISVWVNNAGVTLFARFEETPADEFRRVIETNLFGAIHGARAVLPYFREQGAGVLINIASVAAKIGQPYTSAYVTSKFGLMGLSESLRQEVRGTDIHVCTVLPTTTDTPIFQHAANYTQRAVKPLGPVNDVWRVAEAIVACAEKPRREVSVGGAAKWMGVLHALVPAFIEKFMARKVEKGHFSRRAAPWSSGNLFHPMNDSAGVSGGWRTPAAENGNGHATTPAAVGLSVAVPAVAAWLALRGRRAGRRRRSHKLLLPSEKQKI